ncbi:Intersectin-2 [Thelohanellus kitauei]|uniref:Intersectin-2 n=1 Tax=Thelohanellus kitauei TaxID=669202 RepID=A0A0C2JGJ1_THEKT|nr:Intersectin-2 [Thelohanellus kitauei]
MVVGLYDFKSDLPQELSFSKNERLAIVGEPIGEWWTAKNSSGQIGSIPANYVKEVTLPPKPQKKHQHQEPPKITKKLPKTPLEQLYVGLFDFTATTSEELSFKKGDFLKLVAKSEPDWWMISNMAGQQGLVPSNYIQLKPDADDIQEPVKTKQNNAEECYQVISKCRFEARLDDELEFDEGELLTVLQKQDENWSLARNSNNKVGLIPNTYVNLVDLHGPQSSDSSTEKYVALFDFSKQYEDDLSMKAGDVLFLVNKDDEDWWLMKNTSHETGRVPSTYLKGI